jgi:putative proteasome-type protease
MTVPTLFEAAQLVGRAIRRGLRDRREALEQQNTSFDVMFLLGGQIGDSRMRLFQVYSAGNFIEATLDTPLPADRRAQVRQSPSSTVPSASTSTCSTP